MPTSIGIGFSNLLDVEQAAKTAAFDSKTIVYEDRIDMAILISTVHYDPNISIPIIEKILNNPKMIGCSTAGIILSDSIETRGIAVLSIHSDDIRFGTGSVTNLKTQDLRNAGMMIAKDCVNDLGPYPRHAFMFFVDGQIENTSAMLKGIQGIVGNIFPIIGAGSSDSFRFENTFQIHMDKAYKNSACALIIGGNANIGVGGGHGWRPLGKPRFIDQVNGNIIRTIDGKKASGLYEEFFGREVENIRTNTYGRTSIFYPLGILIKESNDYLIRNAVDILKDGSIVCQGDVPEGAEVHIMIGNKDSCKQAAEDAAYEAQKNLMGKDAKLVLLLDSMARLKLLGRSAFSEIEKIKSIYGNKVPIIGMYSNGEICPFQTDDRYKQPHIQNESIVVLAIS